MSEIPLVMCTKPDGHIWMHNVTLGACNDCKGTIWISESTRNMMKTRLLIPVCEECMLKRMKKDGSEEFKLAPFTKAQLDEVKKNIGKRK